MKRPIGDLPTPLFADPASPRSFRRRALLDNVVTGLVLSQLPISVRAAAPSGKTKGPSDSVQEAASRHFPFGPVVPARPLPPLALTTSDGRTTDLPTLVRGKVTALQLMFTGCSATCPLQGALFMQTQNLLKARAGQTQLLSLTIDPTGDTPAELRNWLKKFGAMPGWLAARPRFEDLGLLTSLLTTGGEHQPGGPDPHTGQVYLIDVRGQLVYRTASMPAADHLLTMIDQVITRG